jgi:hypothetical protein
VVALVTAVNQAVFAFAPVILGVLREVMGGYEIPFLIAAMIQIAAGAVVILGRVRSSTTRYAEDRQVSASSGAHRVIRRNIST